jgi:hypothetical protein
MPEFKSRSETYKKAVDTPTILYFVPPSSSLLLTHPLHQMSSLLFEQPAAFADAFDDLKQHVESPPNDDASEDEWEAWGRTFLDVMVRELRLVHLRRINVACLSF